MKKPVAVLSSNDGCIVSRSQEVKNLGIAMGIPYFQIKAEAKKHDITFFSSNFSLYRDISTRVMTALKEEFDEIEVYSIDEAFFTVSDNVREDDLISVRSRILKKTGIPVSFGIGATKTIAKSASVRAKRGNGVSILTKDTWNSVMYEVSCGSVWNIGRQTTKKLRDDGVLTVLDVVSRGRAYLNARLGVVGERLFFELSGIPVYRVGESADVSLKSITSSRSFHTSTSDFFTLQSALAYHVARVGERLRKKQNVAFVLTIIVAPSRYTNFSYQKSTLSTTLDFPTNDTRVLLRESIQLLRAIFDDTISYKKAGVTISGITPQDSVSNSLFDATSFCDVAHTNEDGVSKVVDNLNERFGQNTVRSGFMLMTEKWRESKKLISPAYTSDWSKIPFVKAV